MLKDVTEYELVMDFANICVKCSDVDLIHMTNSGKLIIGELKNEKGSLKGAQRKLFARIIDGYKSGGAVLNIRHTVDVHKGGKMVDVAACQVVEYYTGGKWHTPDRFITVNEFLDRMEEKQVGANIEGKAKVWANVHDGGWTTYKIGVSNKTQDGNWINAYQPVRFRKGVVIENGTEINYKAFATVSQGKEHNFVIWQITEFSIVENETFDHAPAGNSLFDQAANYTPLIDDKEFPF